MISFGYLVILCLLLHKCFSQSVTVNYDHKIVGGAVEKFISVAVDSVGNLIIAGSISHLAADFYPSDNIVYNIPACVRTCVLLIKFSSSGSLIWIARFDGSLDENIQSMTVDKNDDIFIVGQYKSSSLIFYNTDGTSTSRAVSTLQSSFSGYLVKYSSEGVFSWIVRMDGNLDDNTIGVVTDSNNNIIVAGQCFTNTNSFRFTFDDNTFTAFSCSNSQGIFIGKFSPLGRLLWSARIDDNLGSGLDIIQSLNIDSAGAVYIVGYSSILSPSVFTIYESSTTVKATLTSDNSGTRMGFIVKYSSTGSYVWAARIDGLNNEQINSVAIDRQNNVIVVGEFDDVSTNLNIYSKSGASPAATLIKYNSGKAGFLVKYSSDGFHMWSLKVHGVLNDFISNVVTDKNNDIIIGGIFKSNPLQFYNRDGQLASSMYGAGDAIFVAKYSTSGSFKWAVRIEGTNSDVLESLQTDLSNNIYVVGSGLSPSLAVYNSSNSLISNTLTNVGSFDFGFLFQLCDSNCSFTAISNNNIMQISSADNVPVFTSFNSVIGTRTFVYSASLSDVPLVNYLTTTTTTSHSQNPLSSGLLKIHTEESSLRIVSSEISTDTPGTRLSSTSSETTTVSTSDLIASPAVSIKNQESSIGIQQSLESSIEAARSVIFTDTASTRLSWQSLEASPTCRVSLSDFSTSTVFPVKDQESSSGIQQSLESLIISTDTPVARHSRWSSEALTTVSISDLSVETIISAQYNENSAVSVMRPTETAHISSDLFVSNTLVETSSPQTSNALLRIHDQPKVTIENIQPSTYRGVSEKSSVYSTKKSDYRESKFMTSSVKTKIPETERKQLTSIKSSATAMMTQTKDLDEEFVSEIDSNIRIIDKVGQDIMTPDMPIGLIVGLVFLVLILAVLLIFCALKLIKRYHRRKVADIFMEKKGLLKEFRFVRQNSASTFNSSATSMKKIFESSGSFKKP